MTLTEALTRLGKRAPKYPLVRILNAQGLHLEGCVWSADEREVLIVTGAAAPMTIQASDIRSIHVQRKIWFGLGPERWDLWFG